jgi:hemoglobin
MSKRSPYNTPDYVELYVRLGGAPVVEHAAEKFCEGLLNEPSLAPYFSGIDAAKLCANLIAFFSMISGGPNRYEGRDMRTAHAGARIKGLSEAHLDIAERLCRAAFVEAGAGPAFADEIGLYLRSMRDDILGL